MRENIWKHIPLAGLVLFRRVSLLFPLGCLWRWAAIDLSLP